MLQSYFKSNLVRKILLLILEYDIFYKHPVQPTTQATHRLLKLQSEIKIMKRIRDARNP